MKFNDREEIIAITPQWKGERFPDGRPRVPDLFHDRLYPPQRRGGLLRAPLSPDEAHGGAGAAARRRMTMCYFLMNAPSALERGGQARL